MVLSDRTAYHQVLGCLMKNTLLLVDYNDLHPEDFDEKCARLCFIQIQNLFAQGATSLSPYEVDQEIEKHTSAYIYYSQNHGLELLKRAYEFAELNNFQLYYDRIKKYSLLRALRDAHYDISDFFLEDKDIINPLQAVKVQERCEQSTLEEILDTVESKYSIIRNNFLSGGKTKGDPSENISTLIEELKNSPNIGVPLEGAIFNMACRGARQGCFYLKSASSGCGKTRTAVFDACKMAFPIKWSHDQNTFVAEIKDDGSGEVRNPVKILFIVTEMDKEELQTIMLAYLSGVNESHILTGRYIDNEYNRVKFAATIIEQYHEYFIVEEISDPNLVNISATIKRYAIIDKIEACFFDYIHSTPSLMEEFARTGVREDVCLMMLANQLKQLAKDYNLFIFSATQVNATAMSDDGEFKNETSIRGAKSIGDKADIGFVMTKVQPKFWTGMKKTLEKGVRDGTLDIRYLNNPNYEPTHIIDIYKMRRGRYKNVRIWIQLDLGTGKRRDLFMTTADNQPINYISEITSEYTVCTIDWGKNSA